MSNRINSVMRKKLLSLLVIGCLSVPVVVGANRMRASAQAKQQLDRGVAALSIPIGQLSEAEDLPTNEARAAFRLAREQSGSETLSRHARAMLQVTDAIDALHRGEAASAAQSADAALRLQPNDPFALYVLGVSAARRGDRATAERVYERLQSSHAPQVLIGRAKLARAEWLLDAGRAHDALEVLESLDRESPRVGSVLNLLGLARAGVGDREGALQAFNEAVRVHVHPEIPLLNLARGYRERGQLELAKTTLERALGQAQEYGEAWVAYGVVLADLNAANARHVLVRAAQLSPNDATPLAAQGAIDLREGHYEEAATSFRQALERDPDHAIARTNLGIALVHLGRRDLALRAFEHATTHSPHVGEAWNGLGSMKLSSGDAEGAVGPLRQAMTLLPEDPNPAINLGRALEMLQQWDAAGRAYHEAIRRQPGNTAAIDRLLAITPPADRDRERRRLGLPDEHAPTQRRASIRIAAR